MVTVSNAIVPVVYDLQNIQSLQKFLRSYHTAVNL